MKIEKKSIMQLTYMSSASVLIKDEDSTLLTDPWFVDGEFYGSWYNYPPCTIKFDELENIDGIYISHIHPDHFSVKTLKKMNKHIPIFIHKFHADFLKNAIERLGFNVIEVEHNKRINIKDNLNLRILASDDCDPSLCMKYFGCGIAEKTLGSTTIDTLCAIDNNEQVIINTNDCPFPLAEKTATKIKNSYNHINFLLFGYSSATAFPQCFELSSDELENSQKEIVQKFLSQGESYINLFQPDFYMPFAGRYVLGGEKSNLEKKRAKIELDDAFDYFSNSSTINHELHKGVILNQDSIFDLTTGKSNQKYIPVDKEQKRNYVQAHLLKSKYDYETDKFPSLEDFLVLIPKCFERFDAKRKQLNFSSNTQIFITLPENKMLRIPSNGEAHQIISKKNIEEFDRYLVIITDFRLLLRIMSGPKFAHWNNAEIGSHLEFIRKPNIYERALFYCLNFFHI